MAATFPGGVKAWTDVADNADYILDHHINDAYAEILAIETLLLSSNGGLGVVSAWAPELSGITIGSGVVVARYTKIGKIVYFEFKLTFAADTSITGSISFILPFTVASEHLISGYILDSGSSYFGAFGLMMSTYCIVYVQKTSGTYMEFTAISGTTPMVWGTGDAISLSGVYETT